MQMKSIRIDFPAIGISISNADIPALVAAALMNAADMNENKGGAAALETMARAATNSAVYEYDSKYGGPVFYIP